MGGSCITPASDHQFNTDNHSACDVRRYVLTGMDYTPCYVRAVFYITTLNDEASYTL